MFYDTLRLLACNKHLNKMNIQLNLSLHAARVKPKVFTNGDCMVEFLHHDSLAAVSLVLQVTPASKIVKKFLEGLSTNSTFLSAEVIIVRTLGYVNQICQKKVSPYRIM